MFSPIIWAASAAKALVNKLIFQNSVQVLTGSADPSSSATNAPAGSMYLSTNGNAYVKTDAGSSTNWNKLERNKEVLVIACSDETSDITTGTGKVTFRMPFAMTLTEVRASSNTGPASTLTIDINESGVSILSTKLTFDATEKTTTTASTPAVISDTSLADDAEITIDFDTVGSGPTGNGVKVYLIGYRA